jgi:hypothetical protein
VHSYKRLFSGNNTHKEIATLKALKADQKMHVTDSLSLQIFEIIYYGQLKKDKMYIFFKYLASTQIRNIVVHFILRLQIFEIM